VKSLGSLKQIEEFSRNGDGLSCGTAIDAPQIARLAEHCQHGLEPIGVVERRSRCHEIVSAVAWNDHFEPARHHAAMDAQPRAFGRSAAFRATSCPTREERAARHGSHERPIIYDMRPMTFRFPVVLAAIVGMGWGAQQATTIQVDAGAWDRRDSIVSLDVKSARLDAANYTLSDGTASIALQVDANGRGWFVVPEMKAGTSRTYRLASPPAVTKPGVAATRTGDDVAFVQGDRAMLHYVGGAGVLPSADIKPIFKRGGYLHPVRTPSGRIVTDDYPADHRHHHGIWFAWTKTTFQGRDPDFWNVGDGKARIDFDSLTDVWSGSVQAGLRAQHRYIDLTSGSPITVLNEQWDTRVFATAAGKRPYYVFDVDVVQRNVAADPLMLPEYHYGGIGVRGASAFTKLDNVEFLTSEGKDRAAGDGTESRWAVISGGVDGPRASLAILANPANFRAPERMRIHPTDPYLCFAPSRSGPWSIAKGGTHTARYRLVSFDGPPDAAELQRLWRDYAQPPIASIK
jgi:hypothetical protein